jgi:hypothetical protein
MAALAQLLQKLILNEDPYQDFPLNDYPPDLQGWSSDDPLFEQVIDSRIPTLILEVGTWKGASATHMAELMKRKRSATGEPQKDFAIVCIDTWLGGVEHIDSSIQLGFEVKRKRGQLDLYNQFLANVIHTKHQDCIVPFPNTSLIAARFLRQKQIFADMIYIDASHEEDDVYADLTHYWPILRQGGVMFGDDWDAGPLGYGVICAVNRFMKEKQLSFQVQGHKWILTKKST